MSDSINISRKIEFTSAAKYTTNVRGDMLPERMCSVDWFDGTTLDNTYGYTVTVGGSSDAVAFAASGTPGIKFTTGTGDNEISFCSTGLCFDISQNPAIETKMEITDVSGTTAFFGFSSATSDTTPEAIIDADTATINAGSGITDAVGFVCDADLGSSSLYFASIKTSGTEQYVDTGIDWTDGQKRRLRVRLDSSGNAYGYVDGVPKAYIASAVADVPLCAAMDAGTRANDGANYVYFRYLAKFQDIP